MFVVQEDGNLCIYDSSKTLIWSTGPHPMAMPDGLYVQNDGKLVLYLLLPAWSKAGNQ
jgi:hypothetical protein